MKFDLEQYLPVETYTDGLEVFHMCSKIILFEFSHQDLCNRDIIIRNFIARTNMMEKAVFNLWSLEDYQDCWIIYRCLMDRFFHLNSLNENDQFEAFEAWSFREQYNAVNRVRSDPEFNCATESKMFYFTKEQKERAKILSKNPPVWQRPKAEKIAKQLDMQFLYRFGYDFASTHVHPMANDGEQDFFTTTNLEPSPEFPVQISVLSNSLLIGTMILQEALNASTLSWRAIVYNLIDDLRKFIDKGLDDYKQNATKLGTLFGEGVRLCEAQGSSSTLKNRGRTK